MNVARHESKHLFDANVQRIRRFNKIVIARQPSNPCRHQLSHFVCPRPADNSEATHRVHISYSYFIFHFIFRRHFCVDFDVYLRGITGCTWTIWMPLGSRALVMQQASRDYNAKHVGGCRTGGSCSQFPGGVLV